jgi:HAE1 family hydrophobic/amphiphilic exporter-1
MATVAVTIFGFLCAWMLPVELLPDLSYPSLTIQTTYPDAAPRSVEQFVTRPVEEAVGVIPGVREMRSVSRAGISEVILEFEWNEEMDFAAMDVREKLGLVELPREAERPKVLRFDPSLDPIVRLAFSGDRTLTELRQIAERWVKPRLEAVKGIAAAKVRGGLDAEIQVEADEDRLAALGLTLDDLAQALRAENVNQPGGQLKDWGAVYLVRTLHEFDDLEQLRRTVVRETPTGRVRVEDVASVTRGHRDRDEITRSNGAETVEIALHREGSANTIAVSASVLEELEELRGQMSEDLALTILTDQSRYIGDAIGQVWSAALIGGVLAVLVLFFFLRDPAATGIIAVTIPVSVIATFLPMFKAGVTLNIMSLGGLALGVGMLVDNSIVVLEAIDRHRRLGAPRRRAAAEGGREVAGAVTAATLTTVSVFVPIVFVRGVAGQLFYDLAVTVCIALVASLIASLTLIPMLSALQFSTVQRRSLEQVFGGSEAGAAWPIVKGMVRPRYVLPTLWGNSRRRVVRALMLVSWPVRLIVRVLWYLLRAPVLLLLLALRGLIALLLRVIGIVWWVIAWTFHTLTWPAARALDALGRSYPATLSTAIRMRWVILPVAFALFVLSIAALPLLGTNLVPDLTQGEFAFRLQSKEGSTLENSAQVVGQIENRLTGDPRFASILSVVGSLPSTASGRRTMGENLAQINFALPENASAEDESRAVARVREVLGLFPAVEAELVRPSVLTVRPPVAVNIFSEDLDELDVAAAEVARQLWEVPGIDDVTMTSEPGNPEITIELDRERAAALGVRADPLGRSLRRQIGGEIVGQFREEEERLDIRLRASAESRDRASEIEALRFRLDNGTAIPVSAVARVTLDRGPAAVYRAGGARVAQVLATVSSADLGRTLGGVREMLRSVSVPAGVLVELTGQDEELKVSFDSLKLALALAIFMVYVVMAVQFESLRYPFVILLAVPMGIVGVVAALLLTGTNISVLALIGAVMLAGIVVNNAIVLVDAINRRRQAGEPLDAAIVAAGRERLRPILMTTATTVLALLPMALGLGAGDELRRPMAITVIGGLTVATLLTLIIIPCLYRAFSRGEEEAETVDRRRPAIAGAPEPADPAAL